MKYIWQKSSFSKLKWKLKDLVNILAKARQEQGAILSNINLFNIDDLGEILVVEARNTSLIEGEKLEINSIRSSVAKRLGIPNAGLTNIPKDCDGLVELLIDATSNFECSLSEERLWGWHASLFPTGYSGIHKITVGSWRKGREPMQVISGGGMGREKVRYEAPPSTVMKREMKNFLNWWNNPPKEVDGLIRAAVAHFWFVGIHPFDDGNGRIARAITDMALAQDEKTGKRLYSMSLQIVNDKKKYYDILEKTQRGNGDITEWIKWFLETFIASIATSKLLIEKSVFIGEFYKCHAETVLNERQKKVIKKLLEKLPDDFDGYLTNKKYVSITKTSPETAKRDLKDLVEKEIILLNVGRGRSTSYRLNRKKVRHDF